MGGTEIAGRRHAVDVRNEDGFTLLELLVVVTILGVLLAIAVPAFLGYEGRAADRTAKTNLRETLPSVEAYFNDNGAYTGMTTAGLRASYDSGISPTLTLYGTPTTSYCLTDTVHGHTWSVKGPGVNASSYLPNGTCS